MVWYIYHLLDPKELTPRYIGQSRQVYVRFNQHLTSRDEYPVSRWCRKLQRNGATPIMLIIADDVESQDEADALEIAEIARCREIYGRDWILNVTDGGCVPSWTDEFRALHQRGMRAWAAGRRPAQKTIDASTAAWEDPLKREARCRAISESSTAWYINATQDQRNERHSYITEKFKQEQSKKLTKIYEDKELRAKVGAAVSASMTPEVRSQISKSLTKYDRVTLLCPVCSVEFETQIDSPRTKSTCGTPVCRGEYRRRKNQDVT